MSKTSRDGWCVVWTAFIAVVFGWGVGVYGPGVYLLALHPIHGSPIATISLAITAHYLVSAALITGSPMPTGAPVSRTSR